MKVVREKSDSKQTMDGQASLAAIESAGVRVEFSQTADRIAHRISCRDATEEWRLAAESHESTGADPWPLSPPFQQLHVEHQSGSRVALLVGMAGQSHWSAAVTHGDGGITFDVACLARHAPGRIGSAYQTVARSGESPSFEIQPLDVQTTDRQAREARFASCSIHHAAGQKSIAQISIAPRAGELGDFPATIRWRYVIRANKSGEPSGSPLD